MSPNFLFGLIRIDAAATPRTLSLSTGLLCGGEVVDSVAGHTFEGVGSDQRCTATVQRDGVQVVCGRFWSEIEHCGPDDLGKPDRAHVGALNQAELDQIVAKRDAEVRQRERIAEATSALSGQASTIGWGLRDVAET